MRTLFLSFGITIVSLFHFIFDVEASEKDLIVESESEAIERSEIGYESFNTNKGYDIVHNKFELAKDINSEEFRIEALDYFFNCDEDEIENLMEIGYDVFATGIWDELIRNDSVEAVKYILKYHFKDDFIRRRAFSEAIFYGAESIAKLVIDRYKATVKPESAMEQTVLVRMAYEKMYYGIIEKMAKENFYINTILPYMHGRSILHDVVIAGNLKMLRLLLKFKNLNLNMKDNLGNAPLHYAKNMKIFKALMSLFADPFLMNDEGINTIFMAQPSVTARFELFHYTLRDAVDKLSLKTFVIDRERVLENSFYLASREPNWYSVCSIFDINFNGEAGIDSGGLKREWMSLLMERFFIPRLRTCEPINKPDVIMTESSGTVDPLRMTLRDLILRSSRVYPKNDEIYYGAPFECVDSSNMFYRISPSFTGPVEVYKFIGSIMAKALLMKVPLKVKLVPSLIKLLFGKTLVYEDLKYDDPAMFRSISQCLELDINLNVEDVKGYLEEAAINAMYSRYKGQIDLFIEGFNLIIGRETLESFFTPSEFESVLSGVLVVDRAGLYKNIELIGNYWIDNKEIFWEGMNGLGEEELLEFIRFVTGVNGLPYGGVASLGKKIAIHDEPLNSVPRASTCNFHLNIPTSITTSGALVEMLRIALASSPEFTY
jgi:hypothetical protein